MFMIGSIGWFLVFLTVGCEKGDEAPPGRDAQPFIHEFVSAPGEPLLSYRWDDGDRIPVHSTLAAPGEALEERIPYGELGISDDTRFYLPFHQEHAEHANETGAAGFTPPNGKLQIRGALPGEGIFGAGLQFPDPEAVLHISSDTEPVLGTTWSLEFWVRLPEQPGRATLVHAPGAFDLLMNQDGHCRVLIKGETPFRLKSPIEYRPGAWNHIGMTMEGPELRQLRFSLNGVPTGKLIETPLSSESITIGGFVGSIDELRIVDYPATSAEFEERFEHRVPLGEHELTLEFATRTERVRLWAGVLTEPILGGADWQRGALAHAAERAGALRWVPGHWTRYRSSHAPLPRTTHPTVYVGKQRVFLFGGETRDSNVGGMVNTDDTWIFHTDTGEWFRSQSKESPPPSCHQSAAYSPDHGVVLYAGGQYNEKHDFWLYDETWLYFVEEDRWEKRDPKGAKLPKLADGAIVYEPERRQFLMLAHGKMYLYDPDADRWTKLAAPVAVTAAGAPIQYEPGGSPMVGYDPEHERMVFYGGVVLKASGMVWQNTTTKFDVDSMTHTLFETSAAPPGRVRAGFAYDSKRKYFVLFGGVLDQMSQRKGDLWVFRPGAGEWTAMDASNAPSERGGYYHMAYDPELDRFILLCGRRAPRLFSNEAWALSLDESACGTATYVFDRSAYPARDKWFAEWTAPEGSSVAFRFRSSSDGQSWDPWCSTATEALEGAAPLLQVEVRLSAGQSAEGDSVPEVLRMGFVDEMTAVAAEGQHTLHPVAPLLD